MTIKITAITVAVCAALLYVFGTIFPNDAYFALISSNLVVVVGRLALACLLVHLAFKKKFKTEYGKRVAGFAGAAMIAFGLAGVIISTLTFSLYNYFKPLDFIFLLEAGIQFSLAAASYERGTQRFPRLSRPRHAQLRLFSPRNA